MTYIQKLPVNGTGDKIYPDAAMDAGTRGLIDMIDPWSWGGAVPANGPLAVGVGPKNYPLAEDGWTEDAAEAVTSTMTTESGGVRFVNPDDVLRLPFGFRHTANDKRCGLIFWLKNLPDPAGTGSSNVIYASASATQSYAITIGYAYSSAGVPSALRMRTGWSDAAPFGSAMQDAMFDGTLHQFGFEFELSGDETTIDYRAYLDGKFIETVTRNVNNTMEFPAPGHYAALGLHPAGGSGLNGTAWRAIFEDMSVAETRPFAETVALDYSLNAGRISVVAG